MGCLIALLVWFTLAVTGFSIGGFFLIERDFDLTVCITWILYAICVILFFWKEMIGKYITGILLFLWISVQCLDLTTRTQEGIAGYNLLFEKTHRIIPPSNNFPIPDTYHLVLLFLVTLSLVNVILTIIKTRQRYANE